MLSEKTRRRLFAVPSELKQHRLWTGSSHELSFKFGGITIGEMYDYVLAKKRNDDLTPSELSYIRVIEHALNTQAIDF